MATEWRPLPSPPAGFAERVGLPSLQAQLLFNRGLRSRPEIDAFLAVDDRLRHDPMLLPDMERGVDRLQSAARSGERVGIFGDFDADGVSGTALLSIGLQELGLSVVSYLPDRVEEGHGVNSKGVDYLKERGASLIVTVDCGGGSADEIRGAARMGIDTIVTDHHVLDDDLPPACALISHTRHDSAYPYPHLTGAGTAFKLTEALFERMGRPRPDHLMGLAALGTVADIGPLTGENRFLVKHGLDRLNQAPGVGLSALMASARVSRGAVDTETLGFKLIPRLNAAGRLDHAGLSLDLLTAADPGSAARLAAELDAMNRERRALTGRCLDEALGQVDALSRSGDLPPLLFVGSQTWPPGVLGLIAGRLADRLQRPAVALCFGTDTSRASARSVDGFDMVGSLRQADDLLLRFGGHRQAAGFTVRTADLYSLRRRLQSIAEERLALPDSAPPVDVDAEASPGVVLEHPNFQFVQALAPFGKDNPAPLFLGRGVRVADSRTVGRRRGHLKLRVASGDRIWDAIAFGKGDMAGTIPERVDMLYRASIDDWGGIPRAQLTVVDLRPG